MTTPNEVTSETMSDRAVDVPRLLHDLRNPLTAIQTALMIMREMPADTPLSDVHRHLELMQSALERGRETIDQADRIVQEGGGSSARDDLDHPSSA